MATKQTSSKGRQCKTCGKALSRKQRESLYDFRRRNTCGRECSNKLGSAAPKHGRKCRYCGGKIVRNENERVWQYNRRITCNVHCGSRLREANRKETLRAGPIVIRRITPELVLAAKYLTVNYRKILNELEH